VLRREGREQTAVLAPGASREYEAVPAMQAGSGGPMLRRVADCAAVDAVARGFGLRLAVEAGGIRYLYTFWYRAPEAREPQ